MKYLKSSNWIRLRGQVITDNEICKIDTPVSNEERAFFIPETDDEQTFFNIDMVLNLSGVPCGPTSHNPDDEWGWRWFPDKTEEDMKDFAHIVKTTIEGVYERGLIHHNKDNKDKLLN